MKKWRIESTFFMIVILVLAVFSCKQENTNVQLSDRVNNEVLLQKEIDSLRLQLSLYKDTVFEQRKRLERIKKIIEPLIQQKNYE